MKAAQIASIVLLGAIWYGTSRSSLGLDKEKAAAASTAADSKSNSSAGSAAPVTLEAQERIIKPEALKAMAAFNEYVAGEAEYRMYPTEEPNQYFIQASLKYIPEGGLTEGGLYLEMFVSWKRDEQYRGIIKAKISEPKAGGFVIEPEWASHSQIETYGKGVSDGAKSVNPMPLLKIEIDQAGTWKLTGYTNADSMQKNENISLRGNLKKLSLLEADKFVGIYEGKMGEDKIRFQISKQGGKFLTMLHRISTGPYPCRNENVWVRLIGDSLIAFAGGDQSNKDETWSGCYLTTGRAQLDNEGNLTVIDFNREAMQSVFKKMK